MNYLAHLFLSGDDPGVRTGNFLGDWFRGNQHHDLPQKIKAGVELHRAIDQFADQHALMKQSYKRLRKHIGRYALPVIDVLQDHFLSVRFHEYSNIPLIPFTESCIRDLNEQAPLLPEPFQQKINTMFTVNWLAKYGTNEGMNRSLHNLSKRAKFENTIQNSWTIIQEDLDNYESEFVQFFPEMIQFVRQEQKKIYP